MATGKQLSISTSNNENKSIRVRALAFVVRKEVANHDDVSDVDVDLGYRWHSTYRFADYCDRQAA